MTLNLETVKDIISKPKSLRSVAETEMLVPWLRKRSPLLQGLDKGVLVDILRNCSYQKAQRDDVIIRQGERGDADFAEDDWDSPEVEYLFYIMLSGTVSVYIDPRMTGEDEIGVPAATNRQRKSPTPKNDDDSQAQNDKLQTLAEEEEEDEEDEEKKPETVKKAEPKKNIALDRSEFGKFIMKYDQGKAFGEVALVKRDSMRNASIIADEDVDLLVIGQDLFNRSLKEDHEKEFAEINHFIDNHPFFAHLSQKSKKLLEMSLRKETLLFDTVMVKQGEPTMGLHFIIKGQANVTIEPHRHQRQYPHLWPFEAGIDIYSIEFEYLREPRRQAILRKYEDPAVWETKSESLVIRRTEGYAAVEKHMKERSIDLCSVADREVIGDIELLMNLSTYMHTVKCTANTTVFILDSKNFDRIIGKKNQTTLDIMREHIKTKLQTRRDMKQGHLVPFLNFLHFKLTEESLPQSKPLPRLKTSKTLPDRDTQLQQLLQWFKDGKSTIVEPITPGAVFYKELMKEKAAARRDHVASNPSTKSIASSLRQARRSKAQKKPRSLMEIRESLRQMMEAEVIKIESENAKRQIGSRRPLKKPSSNQVSTQTSRRSSRVEKSNLDSSRSKASSMTSLASLPNFYENSNIDTNNNSFLSILSKRSDESSETNHPPTVHHLPNSKDVKAKPSKPVLVTELAQKEKDLPSINEERTQEEIMLRKERENPNRQSIVNAKPNTDTGVVNSNTVIGATSAKHEHSFDELTASSQQLQTSASGENDISSASRVKLPAIEGATKDSHDTAQSPSKWKTAMTFVNENIERRLTSRNENGDNLPHYDDYEANDANLSVLESRLMAFHIKYGGKAKKSMKLPKLARYSVDDDDVRVPKPGGRVWVRKRLCRFTDQRIQVKDHKHVRHHIVPEIPEFEDVRKQKQVMQAVMGGHILDT